METMDMLLTHAVVEHARTLRRIDQFKPEAMDSDALLPLEPYIEKAVDALKAWHPFVLAAIRKNQSG